MASRQEEKEARRKARLELEAAERRAATRNKRLQMVLGGVLAVGIVAAIVIGISASGGGGNTSNAGDPATTTDSAATLPAQELTDLDGAAEAAGCTLENPKDDGRSHEEREFTAADYGTNPPTSGTHDPVYAQDGIYETSNLPPLGQVVHTLEHGRINVQYKPGTPPELIDKLEAFVVENGPYHMLMYENQTGMEPQVAATTWDHAIKCPETGPKMWDALRTFRDRYIDQGPEKGL